MNATTVLIVEDHPGALAQAVACLRQTCQIVGTATNGLEALDAAPRLDPDLIVMDISMPGLDGFEVARRLKCLGCRSRLIFLTVWEDPDFVREALNVGADAYVVKSRLASDLLTAISDVLAGRKFCSPSTGIGYK